MEIAEIILRFLQAILSWPIIVLILGIVFVVVFKGPISDFLRRIVKGEAYGVRIEASRPSEQKEIAKETPKIESQDQIEQYIINNPKAVVAEYLRLANGYWFERTFNIIYGTQIDLIEYLATKGTNGDKYINLVVFYNEFIKRSGLSSTQMSDYLGFLLGMRFIEYAGEGSDLIVKVTPHGVNFLSYIKAQYPSTYKYKPY